MRIPEIGLYARGTTWVFPMFDSVLFVIYALFFNSSSSRKGFPKSIRVQIYIPK